MSIVVPDRSAWFSGRGADPFPRPNWSALGGWMRAWIEKHDEHEAWVQFTRHWMNRLRTALGGDYVVEESEHFHLVSSFDRKLRVQTIHFLEQARSVLLRTLGDAAWNSTTGKHIVLRFAEADDYYAYIAYYYPDGEHAGSGGVCLHGGYVHIAYLEAGTLDAERQILAHELTHNLLGHLPLPRWLNEALAQAFESDLAGSGAGILNPDLIEEHQKYWNEKTIQAFWSGRSYGDIEGQSVSYNLAQILLDIIHREVQPSSEAFCRFVKQSDWNDAGEAAAREQFDCSLGEIASVFLGDGDWKPKPETWKQERFE